MDNWNNRASEVQNLLNPAFCGRIIYAAINEYQMKTQLAFPFPLIYLILPLVLPQQIRTEISSRSKLTNWAQNHQELLFNFGKRASDLVEITSEAIEFMLHTGYLKVTDNGELTKTDNKKTISKTKFTDSEVCDCILKAENVGRWFADTGKVETIYICLGVRP